MPELFIICDAKEDVFLLCNLDLEKNSPLHNYKIETLPRASLYKVQEVSAAVEFLAEWADQPGFNHGHQDKQRYPQDKS
jgi:hypothetical protein